MKQPGQYLLRFFIALAVGMSVTGLSMVAAWRTSRDRGWWSEHQILRLQLRQLDEVVRAYQHEHGVLPASLSDLPAMHLYGSANPNGQEQFLDNWGHPFVYSVDGASYTIVSLGRDGKPGGAGLGRDLSTGQPVPPGDPPGFREFFVDMPTNGIVHTSIIGGMLAFALSLYLTRPSLISRGYALPVAAALVATVIGAVIAAVVMAGLHIPSGH